MSLGDFFFFFFFFFGEKDFEGYRRPSKFQRWFRRTRFRWFLQRRIRDVRATWEFCRRKSCLPDTDQRWQRLRTTLRACFWAIVGWENPRLEGKNQKGLAVLVYGDGPYSSGGPDPWPVYFETYISTRWWVPGYFVESVE